MMPLNFLIKQAKTGDKEALEELWRQTKRFAFVAARRFCTTAYADMDDLRQCAYLGVHTAVMQHSGRYDFLALVRWCTQRECQKLLDLYGSRRQLRADSLDILLPDGESTPADLIEDESLPEIGAGLEEDELVRDVRAAVAELPERERLIIQRRWFDELSFVAVGKEIGISSERVRQLEARAFDRLRNDPVLRTYARRPPAIRYVARSGLTHFMQTGASSVEHEVLRRVKADATKQDVKQHHGKYAALLASLAAEGYLPADEYASIISARSCALHC